MNAFFIFTKKELTEQWRTYKTLIISAVFLLFGMTSPLMAKLTPEILKSFDLGVEIKIPDPTYIDAYAQFFKNMTQLCLIVVVLVFSGAVTGEKSRGTVVLLLTKGFSRKTFILSKLFSQIILWTAAYAVSAAVCWGYTVYLFPGQAPKNLLLSFFALWLFIVFLLSVSTLAGLFGNSSYIPAIFTFAVWGIMLLFSIIPKTTKYSPLALSSWNMDLITGAKSPGDILIPIIAAAGLTIICAAASMRIFSKQEL